MFIKGLNVMGKKANEPNILYRKMLIENEIKQEYKEFLDEEGVEGAPHYARVFALRKIGSSNSYKGYDARQLILLLEKELPYMW
jgi:hypothetical protein